MNPPSAYRTPGEPAPPPPDSSPDFAAQRKRQRRMLLAIGVVAVVVVGGGIAVAGAVAHHNEVQATNAAVGNLQGCLFRQPLAQGETASVRFRRLQLGTVGAVTHPPPDKAWPSVCSQPARVVLDIVKGGGSSEADIKAISDLATQLDAQGSVLADLSGPIDAAAAIALRLAPFAAPASSDPLPPKALFTVDDLRSVAPLSKDGTSLGSTFTEDNPGLSLPVLIDDKDMPEAPLLCTFRESAATASCRSLKGLRTAAQQGLRLLGTSEESVDPLVFAGRRGSEGVYSAKTGQSIDALYSYGGYARADGSFAILGWDEKAAKLVLSRQQGGDPAQRLRLVPDFHVGNYFYGSQLLWDQILVRGVTKSNERRLFVLPVDGTSAKGFAPADVGELSEPGLIGGGEEEIAHITGCRTRDLVVVRVRGTRDDFLTFRIGGHFSAPVPVPPQGLLGCYGSSASLVFVHSQRIEHDACTSAGCTETRLSRKDIDRDWPYGDRDASDESRLAAVDLAGNLLVVWAAGERGGVRMRIAKPGLFAGAQDAVLLDDLVAGGKVGGESTLLGFRLFAREKFAVLLLSTVAGLHALRIDPDGSVKPWAAGM